MPLNPQQACGAGLLVTAILDELDPVVVSKTAGLKAGDPVAWVLEDGIIKVTNVKGKTIDTIIGVILDDSDKNADGTYMLDKCHTIIQEGEVTVAVKAGDPVKGGKVFVDLATGEFTATGGTELPGVVWYRTGVDANRIGVIKIK
jgi:hypothetical protein